MRELHPRKAGRKWCPDLLYEKEEAPLAPLFVSALRVGSALSEREA